MRFTSDALIQTAADGSEWTMATVRAFEPPHRLELDWFAGAVTDRPMSTSGLPRRVTARE